ncbi:MAG: hypothetical protein ABI609_10965 [Acidobacteriota bacterium]
MRKHQAWCTTAFAALALLGTAPAHAAEFFMPVPNLGANYQWETEFFRQDIGKDDVSFTFIGEGKSGLGMPAQGFKVLPGPSTNTAHPLLSDNYTRDYHKPPARSDPKYFIPGPGLVRMEGESGLLAITSAVLVGGDPITSWVVPLVSTDDAFTAGDTVWVLGLLKDATTSSQLSLYNLHGAPAKCTAKLLSPTGTVLDTRADLTVPSIGSLRIADIMVKAAVGTGFSATVTCDSPFYALGSFPSKVQDNVRVLYPSLEPPTVGTAVTLATDVAGFKATKANSAKYYTLPLEDNTRYRSITIDFDTTAAWPSNDAFFRGLLGMWRNEPGQRFSKTLFFGINERFDRSKLMVDLGTPYIEVLTKKGKAPFVGGQNYHFRMEVNADQQSFHQRVTKAGGALLTDMQSGIFSPDLRKRNGNTLIVGFGLPGIGDQAYSPPYGWRFSNIVIKGYK